MAPPLSYEVCEWLFHPPAGGPAASPVSRLHTQWPGDGSDTDPAVDQFMAGGGPMIADTAAAHALEQARGCTADLLRLADHGVHGNGHGMMFERNNREVLEVILRWLAGLEQA